MCTKQCISCNREMPISSESCVCGHVLSEIKSLEGKRYSGYREELYSRLEIRRILEDHKKPKRMKMKNIKLPQHAKQGINSSLHKRRVKGRHTRKLFHAQKNSQIYDAYNNAPEQKEIVNNPDLWYLNPRYNFTDALADINRRLISQTRFWIRL